MIFTISARGKKPRQPVFDYLARNYANIPIAQIDSIFGFVEKSTLYGGRHFVKPELSDQDIRQLYDVGIGLRIPFSNQYVKREEYENSRLLLQKYHRKGNSVIVHKDKLVEWIRQDFPDYQIEASVIKNINTHEKIKEAMEIYDTVVLPMKTNEDHEFLKQIENKEHITLFGNAGCALTCPSKICYPSISKMNKFEGAEFKCSQGTKHRDMLGMIDFDLDVLSSFGFNRFKMLRAREGGATGY